MVFAQVAASFLSFGAVWLATKEIGAGGYGGVVAVLAASQFIGQLTFQWSTVALFKHGCEEFVQTGRLAATFWTRLALLMLLIAFVFSTSGLWLAPLMRWLRISSDARYLILAHIIANALAVHVLQSLQAAKLPRFNGFLVAGERLLLLCLMIGFTSRADLSWSQITLIYVSTPILTIVVGLWRIRLLIFPAVEVKLHLMRQLVAFSLPLIPFSLIGYFSTNYFDAFFISYYLTPADLGVYSIAYQVAGALMQLPVVANSLLLAYFVTLLTAGQSKRVSVFFRETLPALALMWSVVCVFCAALGGYLLPMVFGPKLETVGPILWPLMAAAALTGPMFFGYSPLSNAKSATYISLAASAVSALTNIGLNYVLVPRFGLAGCAWATATAFGTCLLTASFLVRRILRPARFLVFPAVLPALLGAVVAAFSRHTLIALLAACSGAVVVGLILRIPVTRTLRAVKARSPRADGSKLWKQTGFVAGAEPMSPLRTSAREDR